MTKAIVSGAGEAATVSLPRALSAWKENQELLAVAFPPEALVLMKQGGAYTGFLAGSLSSLSADELFGYVISGVRTGRLFFVSGEVRKSVSFRDGQVVFATSNASWERFGAVLVTLGHLTRQQLEEALREVKPGKRLGQVLTAKKWVVPSRLYGAMTHLVREIVVGLFCETEGHLLFLEDLPPGDDALKLPQPAKELAVEGLKRQVELMRLQGRLPPRTRLAQTEVPPTEVAPKELWDLFAGAADVGTVRDQYEGSEHQFLGAVDALVAAGALEVMPKTLEMQRPVAPQYDARPVTDRYDAIIRLICKAITDTGHDLSDLESFLADPLPGMEDAFKGVTLGKDGSLDIARVQANFGTGPSARLKAYEALGSFVSYAVFSARNVVSPEVAEQLTRESRKLQEGT